MTLKEAYEVFFGNTNERITGKFIIENVSIAEFKNRHRELLRKWHPDMNPNNLNIAHEMTIKIRYLTMLIRKKRKDRLLKRKKIIKQNKKKLQANRKI